VNRGERNREALATWKTDPGGDLRVGVKSEEGSLEIVSITDLAVESVWRVSSWS
jgi:hypothetical protein